MNTGFFSFFKRLLPILALFMLACLPNPAAAEAMAAPKAEGIRLYQQK